MNRQPNTAALVLPTLFACLAGLGGCSDPGADGGTSNGGHGGSGGLSSGGSRSGGSTGSAGSGGCATGCLSTSGGATAGNTGAAGSTAGIGGSQGGRQSSSGGGTAGAAGAGGSGPPTTASGGSGGVAEAADSGADVPLSTAGGSGGTSPGPDAAAGGADTAGRAGTGGTGAAGTGTGGTGTGGTGTGGTTAAGGTGGSSGTTMPGGVLAATPPMGWNSWNKFGCTANDSIIRDIADAMATSGMKDVGYQYVNIDDCWQASRNSSGTIVPDANFPDMKALADYVHSKGLKLGLYSDRGTTTCSNRPGSQGYETQDAKTYAAWGIDYLKYDNCNATLDQETQFRTMSDALKASGRPIVFSICAWQFISWMPSVGNLWRTTGDITNSWSSVMDILDKNAELAQYAGPGHWNDPDMLEVGNGGLTDIENRAHFGIWAMMAAPLIAGNDIRSMSTTVKDILTASEIVAVDQDALGVQGTRIKGKGALEVWKKKLSGSNTMAVAFLNRTSAAANISVSWTELGLPAGTAKVRDLWAKSDLDPATDSYTAKSVPSHGITMLKITSQ